MSRSYHKVAHWKLKQDQYFKRLVHKRGRHILDMPNGSWYKYVVNPYDICDYIFPYYTSRDFRSFFRYDDAKKFYKIWRK